MQKQLHLLYKLSLTLTMLLFTWQPATAETTETLTLDDYLLRLIVMPSAVATGDTVTLIVQALQRDDQPADIYFWVDTPNITITEVSVAEGRLRCTYQAARLLCFVEDLTTLEQVIIRGVVTGPAPDRLYFFVSAGQFAGGIVQLALQLTWRQVWYFPLVTNGNN